MGSGGRQRSSTHRSLFKANAKNRVDDLQGMFCGLQQARKENRSSDVALLEEQVNQMLREWKAELHKASPAGSLQEASPSSSELSSDMERLLQLTEEDDDASSSLSACLGRLPENRRSPLAYGSSEGASLQAQEQAYHVDLPQINEQPSEEEMAPSLLHVGGSISQPSMCNEDIFSLHTQYESPTLLKESFSPRMTSSGLNCPQNETLAPFPLASLSISAAFLGPKCALWDCPRPATGAEWFQDYCSDFHANLAVQEGAHGQSPVVRPGGIDLKDGPLFSALSAKCEGKAVGIPECEGAATSRSPWNAHDHFDILMLHGEVIREWLFFDKPRRAFESGSRKQRSLPDYNGRGWHESRKQIMKDLGGLKRSYYMDPQPDCQFEWHLYEYELSGYDSCALYRLELKQVNLNKKSGRLKLQHDQMTALQNQIGRLPANLLAYDGKVWPITTRGEPKSVGKGRAKVSQKGVYQGLKSDIVGAQTIAEVTENLGPVILSSLDYSLEDVSSYLVTP